MSQEMCVFESYELIRRMYVDLSIDAVADWEGVRTSSPAVVSRIEEIEGMDTSSLSERELGRHSYALFRNYGIALDRYCKKRESKNWKKTKGQKSGTPPHA